MGIERIFGCIIYDTVGSAVEHSSSFSWHQQSFDFLLAMSRTAFRGWRKVQGLSTAHAAMSFDINCCVIHFKLHYMGSATRPFAHAGANTVRGCTVLLCVTTSKITESGASGRCYMTYAGTHAWKTKSSRWKWENAETVACAYYLRGGNAARFARPLKTSFSREGVQIHLFMCQQKR